MKIIEFTKLEISIVLQPVHFRSDFRFRPQLCLLGSFDVLDSWRQIESSNVDSIVGDGRRSQHKI